MSKMISDWLDTLKAFSPTNKSYFKFIKENIGLILLFSAMTEAFQHYFISADRLTAGTTSQNMMAKFGLAMASLLSVVFYQMIVPLRLQPDLAARKEPFWGFVSRQTKPYFLESMRVLGKCLLILMGCFLLLGAIAALISNYGGQSALFEANQPSTLLIIMILICSLPALFFYLRYSFVPYIALIDPVYQAGQRDALKHSFNLMKGAVLPVVLIFAAIAKLEMVRTRFREEYSLLNQPIMAFLLYVPFELVGIYINILLFYVYQLKQQAWDQSSHSVTEQR